MLVRQIRCLLQPLGWIALAATCRADISPEVVALGKHASALVELAGGRSGGSAFCINASGYFLTTARVANAGGKSGLTLILHAGEKDQLRLSATVVRQNADSDLALLYVKPQSPLVALSMSPTEDPVEASTAITFGYPAGRDPARADSRYPVVTVRPAHVASLRKLDGKLDAIQLDLLLQSGYAGGPVLNAKGKLIGVVSSGDKDAVGSYAVSAQDIKRFLDTPDIIFMPPNINTSNARNRHSFTIRVETYPEPIKATSVEFKLSSGPQDIRSISVRPGVFHPSYFYADVSPLPAATGPHTLKLTIEDSQSRVVCTAPDQVIFVGGRRMLLSAFRVIEPGNRAMVTLENHRRLEGAITGLDAIETRVLGASVRQNLTRANRITIEDNDSPTSSIAYHIVVKQEGKPIGTLNGELVIAGSHAPRVVSDWVVGTELLVCCYFSNSVKRFNARTGAFIDDYLSGNGLTGPTAVVVGPDGNLYVTGGDSQTVHRFNGISGQFMDAFIPKDIAGGLRAPNGMAFGPDGNLYVGCFNSREVRRYNGQTGTYIDTFVPAGSGGLNQPGFLMFAPDGNLLVASVAGRSIKRYDGKSGAYLGDFLILNGNTNPNGFCLGPDGKYYVCCYRSKSIERFEGKTGTYLDTFVGPDGLNNREPVGIAFGTDLNLYVSTRADEVRRFDGATGEVIDTFLSGSDIRFPQYMIFLPTPIPHNPH